MISVAVVLLGIVLKISRIEWAILFLTFCIVMVTEILNTAIEKTIDLITEDFHPLAKVVKNTAAGAVLLAAFSAVVIGFIVFIPYLWR